MTSWGRLLLSGFLVACLGACTTVPSTPDPQIERDAIAARMMGDIEVLASDDFGGRKPGSPGGIRTISYIIERMQAIGLQSGTNDPGSAWRAPVELVSTKPLDYAITVRTAEGAMTLPVESSAAYSHSSRVLIDGVEVVFVGTGTRDVPASEITGRIVVMTQLSASSEAREALFAANPAAIITVLPTDVAFLAQRRTFERERLFLASDIPDQLTAFVTRNAFSNALPTGEWDRLVDRMDDADFRFELLEATIAIDVQSERREFTSFNVIGQIPGQLPESGAVLLLAHWDHLGECAVGTPDPICNGAVDNASGVALMLELADRLNKLGPYDRDIYFLATSAEEAGLLGVRAFVKAPPIPLKNMVGAFNFDSVAVAPAGGAFGFVGEGKTSLDALVQDVVRESGAQLGNREFAAGFERRHDGWALLERGVPSVLVSTAFASRIVLGPYLASDYHRPSDEAEGLEMGGAVDDLLLHEKMVGKLANTSSYPGPYRSNATSVSQ